MILKLLKDHKLRVLFSLFLIIVSISFYNTENVNANNNVQDDMNIIKERLLEVSQDDINYNEVKKYLNKLEEDGGWNDINYSDKTMADWDPRNHVQRLEKMVLYYKNNNLDVEKRKKLKNKIMSAYNYWLEKDPVSENWWHNEIGIQKHFRVVLLNMKNELSEEELKKGIEVLKQSGEPRKTGQNLVDLTMIYIWRGIIEEDPMIVKEGFRRLAEEIKITTDEGIQPDYSFQQHGDLLYTGTYGKLFVSDMAQLAWLPSGTDFSFPPEKINILENYILDGFQWIVYNNVIDYGTLGRGVTRKNVPKLYEPLIGMCDQMVEVSNDRKKEFRLFKNILTNSKNEKKLTGNKYFWNSDHMVHRKDAYYTSVKMVSKRTIATESGNGEGLLNYHISDGFNMLMVNGDEYKNIFPVWDWNKIPGTTTAQINEKFPLVDWGEGARGLKKFVGGVSDGEFGLAAMQFSGKEKDVELNRETVKSKKSWFFFENEIVALGTDINYNGDNKVLTSINQANLQGNVFIKDKNGIDFSKKYDKEFSKAPDWIFHDDISYLFLNENQKIYLKADSQSGSWRRINNRFSDQKVEKEVFSLGIEHGSNLEGAKYEYLMIPDAKIDELVDYEVDMPIDVLANNSKLQAVSHNDLNVSAFVFHEEGEIEIENNLKLKVDKPVLLMVKANENNLELNISNPLNHNQINLEINRELEGDNVHYFSEHKVSKIKIYNNSNKNPRKSIKRTFKIIN